MAAASDDKATDRGQLVVHMFSTLDGVVQSPGEPDEDLHGGFPHGGWQVPYLDAESGEVMVEHYAEMDALLLGRRTYEIFARYWPAAPPDHPFRAIMNDTPKYVATSRTKLPAWTNSQPVRGDLAEAVHALRSRHRQIHVPGSAAMVQTLLRDRLVDRLNLWLYPIALGTGKRLFPGGTVPTAFRVAASRAFRSGTVLLQLATDGEPGYGTMAWES